MITRAYYGLLITCICLLGCDRPRNESRSRQTAEEAKIPLDEIEARITALCSIELGQWRRAYYYKWLPKLRRYDQNSISFSLDRGPYDDLRPGRAWRDLGNVVNLDDRPNIELIYGHYDLTTKAVEFRFPGPCISH